MNQDSMRATPRAQVMEEPEESVDFHHHSVVVVVPSFNEERYIGSMLLKLMRFPVKVIVVDDGSTDETADIAERAGAQVICLGRNQGKGVALNVGFQNARALNPEAIVMIDADGQHLPEELPRVVRPILDGEADIVVGSRYLRQIKGIPVHRVVGHLFFRWLTNTTSGIAVSDTQSGYRAFSPRAFQKVNFRSRGFSVESEMQFMARDQGLRITEVPITIRYPDPPKRSVLAQGLAVLNGILRLTGQYRPLLFFALPGFLILLAGIGWGVVVIEIYTRTLQLAIGYTLISVMLSILGLTMFSTGVILHSVRGLLIDLLKTKER